MTKSDARALLVAQNAINKALDRLQTKLSETELAQFSVYYGARMRAIVNNCGYGSMPTSLAQDVMDR